VKFRARARVRARARARLFFVVWYGRSD
jgi:hypothetical protein